MAIFVMTMVFGTISVVTSCMQTSYAYETQIDSSVAFTEIVTGPVLKLKIDDGTDTQMESPQIVLVLQHLSLEVLRLYLYFALKR